MAVLIVCLASTFVLAACNNVDGDTDATYYLSVDGATYSSESAVPTDVKFANSDDVYTLTVKLEAGKVLTVNKVGSDDKIGYSDLFSSAEKLTQGSNNAMVVAENGTFAFTLDPTDSQPLSYVFTSSSSGGGDSGTSVTSVTLNKHELTLGLEGFEKLIATVAPATAINKNLLWTSSNRSVAEVDQEGNVTAIAAGKTTIKVESQENGGLYDECQVTVSQNVTSISLSTHALTVYTGDGATARELEVTISPSDATNQEYTVQVQQDDEFVTYVKAGKTITITGKAVGTATLTVVSNENPSVKDECVITVMDINDAAPALDKDNAVVDIEGEATVNIILDKGEITSFTVTSNATGVATATKASSGNSFTVKGVAFGTATVTVEVTYGDNKTANLSLTVRVAADYYFLTGNFDKTSWGTPSTVDGYLTTYKVLMTETQTAGVYEISRHFAANEMFYVLPSTGDNWTNALKKGFYTAQNGGSTYFDNSSNNDNVIVKYAGNYTVRLDIRGTKASWTIIVDSIDIIGASLTTSATSIRGSETVTLTFAINPSVVSVPASSIAWSVKEEAYRDWVTLDVDSAATSATLALSDKFTNESVNITIVVVVTVDGQQVAETEQQIALLGNTVKPVTSITFDDEGDVLLDVTNLALGQWTVPVTAHVNDDASIQTITYSIKEGTLYANNDSTHLACSIDGNGTVTAWMFGTYTVVATSDGTNSDGSLISVEKTVHVYASTFYLNIAWDKTLTSNPSTTITDYTVYTWTNVKFAAANQAVVILYAGLGASDEWYSVIRSGSYLDSANSTSGAVSGTSGGNGNFTVKTTGMYTVTLDLSGSKPSVKFVRTGDVVSSDTWENTTKGDISVVGADNTWNGADDGTNIFYTVEAGQAISNVNPYVFVTYGFTAAKFATIATGAKCALAVGGNWYMGNYYGNKFDSSYVSGKWAVYNGNLEAYGFSVANTTWTFIVKFNEDADVIGVQIEQGEITSASQFTDIIGK